MIILLKALENDERLTGITEMIPVSNVECIAQMVMAMHNIGITSAVGPKVAYLSLAMAAIMEMKSRLSIVYSTMRFLRFREERTVRAMIETTTKSTKRWL